MNHPFPENLPLLRRIYADRFTAVRFLIPFERSDAPDVITVYRGSYVHAAYITDARAELAALDCDYYLVIHDDVLLNPQIREGNFLETFTLEPDDGFIPTVTGAPPAMGSWVWYYGMIAKLLFPKSILFGGGVEPGKLKQYLPSFDRVREAMEAANVWPALAVQLDESNVVGIETADTPSRLLFHGYAEPLASSDAQQAVDARSLRLEQELIATMAQALRARPREPVDGETLMVPLPLPLAAAGYATDFYILPRSGLDDFCHYMGVAAAANLFVEVIAPTLLFACCDRVRTGHDLGLDFTGFDEPRRPEWLLHDKAAAIHPFKLSAIKSPDAQDAFIAMLAAIGAGHVPDDATAARAGFGLSLAGIAGEGWSHSGAWGLWSVQHDARLAVRIAAPTELTLDFFAPLHPDFPSITGRIIYNGGEARELAPTWPGCEFSVTLPLRPDADGIARMTVHADRLVVPADWGDGSGDTRSLGFGIRRAAWNGHVVTGESQTVHVGR